MKSLSLERVLRLYHRVMEETGGLVGVRDLAAPESALAQPGMSFGGEFLYPTIEEKASALGYSLLKNHPFTDGNKRMGFVAMESFLRLNGFTIRASVDESENAIRQVAAGAWNREHFTQWLRDHVVSRGRREDPS